MSYYIIFAPTISGIGGAELYVKNKVKWLLSKGWNCCIIAADDKKIMIPEFLKFSRLTFPEIVYPVYYYSNKSVSKVVESIVTGLETYFVSDFYSVDDVQILVESIDIPTSTWADVVAERIGTRNFLYFVGWDALFSTFPKTQRDYTQLKAERNELILASRLSPRIMFGDTELSRKVRYFNVPVVREDFFDFQAETYDAICQREDEDLIVLTVTRLEKPYLRKFLDQMIVLDRKGYRLKILVLGGSLNAKLQRTLEREYSDKFRNSKIEFLGWAYPLPYRLFKCVDVFVGMGTSVLNAASVGTPSIVVDFRSNMSAGFFGVDTENWVYSSSGDVKDISEDLERAIKDKSILEISSKRALKLIEEEFDQEKIFTSFLEFMISNTSLKPSEHTASITEIFRKPDLREAIKSTVVKTFGRRTLDVALDVWFRLIGRRKLEKLLSK